MTASATSPGQNAKTSSLIRVAGLSAALGIALSLTDYADVGRWLTVLGVILLLVGLHRFGRAGPDAPIVVELPSPRKKKRKKQAVSGPSDAPAGSSDDETKSTG